jgi:diguanylate cyclase (GGDEF)-like protein/PAS domain S-box-containing protein
MDRPTFPQAAAAAAAERVHAARVEALFGVAGTAYLASLAAAAILAAILWERQESAALALWLAGLAAVTLARLVLHGAYRRSPARFAPARWEGLFALGAFAAGLLWAVPPFLFFPVGEPLLQMGLIVVVGGLVIGATGVYAASAAAFFGYCALPVLAVMAQLAQQPGRTYQLLALLALAFGAAMVKVYRDIQRAVVASLASRIEHEELFARVAASEGRLRAAIESFPEGIAIYDAEERLVVCNDAYAALYGAGKAAPELAGTHYRAILESAFRSEEVPPEYEGRFDDWIADRLARRASGAGAVRHFRTRDGRSLQGREVRSRGGGVVSAFTDVTELDRSQEAYRRLLAEENLILDTLPVGVAFVADRRILRCNRRLEQMLGYAPGELQGASTRRLHASEEAWRRAESDCAQPRAAAVHEADLELARKDGSRLWCRVLSRAVEPERPERSAIVAFSDISERHAATQALRASEALFRNLVETSSELIWSVDASGRWTYLNPAAVRRIYGRAPEEMLGLEFREVLAPEVRERDLAVFQRILAGESVFDYETRHLRGDGTPVDLSFNAIALRDAGGAIVGATGTAHDITREKQAMAAQHETVEKLRLAVELADLIYWEWDRASDRLHWGGRPLEPPGEGEGRFTRWADYRELVHPDDRERYLATVASAWEQAGPCSNEYRVIGRDGQSHWISSRGKTLRDAAGRATRMIGVSQDITERKRQEEEARFLAHHDTLTGLPNRRLLEDRLRQALFGAQRRGEKVAVMMIDLDRFKQVNDALGHRAGDRVLAEAARRVAGCVRRADTLARHGGDEFVVVVTGVRAAEDCRTVGDKVLRALEAPFAVEGREFRIGASIGVSLFPADAGDADALLRNADVAMYRAKQRGTNACVHYAE